MSPSTLPAIPHHLCSSLKSEELYEKGERKTENISAISGALSVSNGRRT